MRLLKLLVLTSSLALVCSCAKPNIESTTRAVSQETFVAAPSLQKTKVSLSSTKPVSFAAACEAPWVRVTPASGKTPTDLELEFVSAGLAAGVHTTKVTVRSEETEKPLEIAVTLTVKKCKLSASVSQVSLNGLVGGDEKHAQKITVATDPPNLPVSWKVEGSEPWVVAVPREGKGPGEIQIIANSTGRKSGTHTAKVVISSNDVELPVEVPVSLTLKKCALKVESVVTIGGVVGQASITRDLVVETEPPGRKIAWSAKWNDDTLLKVEPRSGTTPTKVTITAKSRALPEGTQSDIVAFESEDAESPAKSKVIVKLEAEKYAPDAYKSWDGCKDGSSVTFDMDASGNKMTITKTRDKKDGNTIMLKTSVKMEAMPDPVAGTEDVKKQEAVKTDGDCPLCKKPFKDHKDEGKWSEKSMKIGAKEVRCHVYEPPAKMCDGKDNAYKMEIWYSDDVPGQLVMMKSAQFTMTATAFEKK